MIANININANKSEKNLIIQADLTESEKNLLLAIGVGKKRYRDYFPSRITLGNHIDRCERQVSRVKDSLIAKGLIGTNRRCAQGPNGGYPPVTLSYWLTRKGRALFLLLGGRPPRVLVMKSRKRSRTENVSLLNYNEIYILKSLIQLRITSKYLTVSRDLPTNWYSFLVRRLLNIRNVPIVRRKKMQEGLSPIKGLVLTEVEIEELMSYPSKAVAYVEKQAHLCRNRSNPMAWIRAVLTTYMERYHPKKGSNSQERTFEEHAQKTEKETHQKEPRSVFPQREARPIAEEYYRSILLQETPKWKEAVAKLTALGQPIPENPFAKQMVSAGLSTEINQMVMSALRWQEYLAHKDGNQVCSYCVFNGKTGQYNPCHFFPLASDKEWVTFAYSEFATYHLNADHTKKTNNDDQQQTKIGQVDTTQVGNYERSL